MPARAIRNRLLPYRILIDLLYGQHPWLSSDGPGEFRIVLGPASRHFRISLGRLRDQLAWLHEFGFAPVVEIGKREARLVLRLPRGLVSEMAAGIEQSGPVAAGENQ